MKQSNAPLPQGSVSEQADYWVTLLNSPLADARQQRAFQQWLAANDKNRQAFAQAQAFWQQMDGLDADQIHRLEQRLLSKPADLLGKEFHRHTWPFMTVRRAIVFGCLLLACYIGVMQWPRYFADYSTGAGETETVLLSDGSTVILNTETALSVDYSENRRLLTLYDGEAYFKVAPDADRPFVVSTEFGQVRALGTAFEIKEIEDKMTVTVFEHAVRVAFNQGKTIERLEQGESVAFVDHQILPIAKTDLQQAGSWRDQRLVFVDQPLQQVITELDRYRLGKIVILDPQLASHNVTGVFNPYDTETSLSAIADTLHLKQFRITDRLVFLSRHSD